MSASWNASLIAVNVQFCIRRDGRVDVTHRRAGPSASTGILVVIVRWHAYCVGGAASTVEDHLAFVGRRKVRRNSRSVAWELTGMLLCVTYVQRNSCIIDGICYRERETSPTDHCLVCKAINDQFQWTTLSGLRFYILGGKAVLDQRSRSDRPHIRENTPTRVELRDCRWLHGLSRSTVKTWEEIARVGRVGVGVGVVECGLNAVLI